MSKAFNRAVEALFIKQLTERAPDFARSEPDRLYGWPCGERAFARKKSGRVDWLSLCFSKDGRDEFTVDVGWSYLGRYPRLPVRPTSRSCAELVSACVSETFVRVRPISGSQFDWWSASEGQTNEGLVLDALDCIERFALPTLASLPSEKPGHSPEPTR